ncbi:MAG: hypothetical protein KA338_24540 [Chloroflexi bacterium]|nr:hypothetical protein [Chloroflexota bacterium]
MSSVLVIPILVDALALEAGQNAVDAFADFTQLPYVGRDNTGEYDSHSDRPFLTETVVAPAFSDTNFLLQPGVHLHWALPTALTRAVHPLDQQTGQPDRQRTEFPSAPDRWLVCRWRHDQLEKAWLRESDYLWSPEDVLHQPQESLTNWPYRIEAKPDQPPRFIMPDGEPPFRFLGRGRELGQPWPQKSNPAWLKDIGQRLTAIGYGETNFAAFYPNCRSVFGHYDNNPTPADGLWYELFGWYDNPQDDPFHQLVTRLDPRQPIPAFVTAYETSLGRQIRFRLSESGHQNLAGFNLPEAVRTRLQPLIGRDFFGQAALMAALSTCLGENIAPPIVSAVLACALPTPPAQMVREQIRQQFSWDWPDDTLPDHLICYGRVYQADFVPPVSGTAPEIQVAVANSGTEALAALVATHLAEQRFPLEPDLRFQEKARLETHLEALMLQSDLSNQLLDVGDALTIARHRRSFTAVPGTALWVIRPQTGATDEHGPEDGRGGINLPLELAHFLDGLNAAQAAYDRGRNQIDSLRWQTYSDWYRTMRHSYPAADEVRDFQSTPLHLDGNSDVDAMFRHLRHHTLHELAQARATVGEIISLAPDAMRVSYQLADSTLPAQLGFVGADTLFDTVRTLQLQRRDDCWQTVPGTDRSLEFDLADHIGPDTPGQTHPETSLDQWRLFSATGQPTTLYRLGGWWQSADGGQILPVCLALEVAHFLQATRNLLRQHNDDPAEVRFTNLTFAALQKAFGSAPLTPPLAAALQKLDTWRGRTFAARQPGETLKQALRREGETTVGIPLPGELHDLIWSLVAEQWRLDQTPGPRFWQPNDPVLLLAGQGATPTDRWQTDGTPWHDTAGNLTCLLTDRTGLPNTEPVTAELDWKQTRQSEAGRQRWQQIASALRLDKRQSGRVHPFLLEWEAEFAAVHAGSNLDSEQDGFAPDYLQRNWSLAETEHALAASVSQAALTHSATMVRGRAVLSSHAHPVLTRQLENYLLFRLQEPSIPTDKKSGASLSFAQAATYPADQLTYVSWLAHYAPDKLVNGQPPQAGTPACTDLLTSRQTDITTWIRTTICGRDLLAAVQAWAKFQAVTSPAWLANGPRLYGLPDQGGLAAGILACLHHILAGEMGDAAAFLRDTVMLDATVITRLRASTYSSLSALDGAIQAGPTPFIRLLRCADAYGYILPHPNRLTVLNQPLVMGLPEGGAIQQVLCDLANNSTIADLSGRMGLRPSAVQAIVEAREIKPLASLGQLASLPGVSAATLARLLVFADQNGQFQRSAAATPPSSWHSWPDEYGHARVDALETTLATWVYLQTFPNVLTQAMGGFHDALLMRERSWQLPVADPLAFDDYRAFTEEVIRPNVGRNRSTPLWENEFHPFRAGDLALMRLRLVDTFGQEQALNLENIHTTTTLDTPRGRDMMLPPRLTQPARLNLRWLAGDGSGLEWNSHPALTPICGWLVVNNLTAELTIYDSEGVLQGSLDIEGQWRLPPGATGPVRPDDLDNLTLRRMVNWLQVRGRADDTFIEAFGETVETALENINPETFQSQEALSLLMSRPVALVQLQVSFELQHPPATNQSLAAFAHEVEGGDRQTEGFEQVLLPLRMGEHQRFNDGVIGFWVEDEAGDYQGDVFHAPQSHWLKEAGLDIYRDQSGDQNLGLSLAGEPLNLVLLLDPRGRVHATSGLLPVKEIGLPADEYAAALNRIEINFLTAPILTPQGHIQLALPQEPGWSWSWIAQEQGRWLTLPDVAVLAQEVIEKAFPDQPLLWGQLIAAGVLEVIPGVRGRALIKADAFAQGLQQFEATLRPDLQRVLEINSRTLESPDTQVKFPPLELREGWLRLRRNPND